MAPTTPSQPSSAPQTTRPQTPHPSTQKPRRSPVATPRATESGAAGGVVSPSPTPGEDRPGLGGANLGPSPLVTILVGTLLALGVLGLIGLFAMIGARRRRHPDTRLELLPEEAREAPPAETTAGAAAAARAERQPTSWERDWALDDAPIGSVEYRPPPEPFAEDDGA